MSILSDTRKYSEAMREALEAIDCITPSVLMVARVVGIKPQALAQAIAEGEETSLYRNSVASALQDILVKKAVQEAKEKKESKE